jgi:hypothetical protein
MQRPSTVRARSGRLSALSVFLCKSLLYGAFVWARRALNRRKWHFPARADESAAIIDDGGCVFEALDAFSCPIDGALQGAAMSAPARGG